MRKLLAVSLLLFVAGGFATPSAFAQSENAIAISPLTFEITVNPGDVITNAVRLYNPGSEPLQITMRPEDFTPSGEGGQAVIEAAESTGYSIATWTTLAQDEILLSSGEVGLVEFTVAVPANAEPGGHYGAITAEARAGSVNAGGAGIAQKVAVLLLVSVSGNVQESLAVTDFNSPSNFILDASAITLTSRFENRGSVHLKPRGFVTITDTFGREVGQIALDQRNVLPGTKRIVETKWQPEGFMMGRMHAQLAAIYGSSNEPLVAATTFWVIPMNVLGPVLAIFGGFLVFGLLFRRRLALAASVLVRGQH